MNSNYFAPFRSCVGNGELPKPTSEDKKTYLKNEISGHSLIETVLLFGVIVVLVTLFSSSGLNEMSPHPFWIPVVLLSVQYGTNNGLIAAFTAIILVQMFGLPYQAANEDYYNYLVKVSMEPALWLMVAIVLGEIRTRHIIENKRICQQLQTLEKERLSIADYCRTLGAEIAALEHKIAVQGTFEPEALTQQKQPPEPAQAA